MPLLKYSGPLPLVEVGGYGHFSPGEEKTVDERTATDFDCPSCEKEGWTVTFDGKSKRADTESTTAPAKDESPRGPRQHRNH